MQSQNGKTMSEDGEIRTKQSLPLQTLHLKSLAEGKKKTHTKT